MRWDYTITGTPGYFDLRRDGVEAGNVLWKADVELLTLRMSQLVAACNALDEIHEADAHYRALGWVSKAEHDYLWGETYRLINTQERSVIDSLRDLWRGDELALPLSRLQYDEWRRKMGPFLAPTTEAVA